MLKDVSVVVSVYNEKDGLNNFTDVLINELSKLNITYEIIFVNDGSHDGSEIIIDKICTEIPQTKAIHFSRNFGHEAAMLAGIDYANSKAIICLDADLQHPPNMIKKMINEFHKGYEIINMVREKNKGTSAVSDFLSHSFYKFLNRISPVSLKENASDFFLISKRVADILKKDFRERNRFLRGFIQIIGFKKTTLSFVADERQFGKSKYSLKKLMILSANAIVSFSKLPLHLGLIIGIIFGIFSLSIGIYSLIMRILGSPPPGYTTLIVFISLAFAIQFIIIGIIGIYVGYAFEETKKRPIYLIDKLNNLEV